MPVNLSVVFKSKQFERAMREAPDDLHKALRLAFKRYLVSFQARMSKERLRGRPGLNRQTGGLALSQQVAVRGAKLSRLVGIYSIGGKAAPYARIHEFGGVIRPVRAKYLTIPLEAARASGVGAARGSARDFDLHLTVRNGKLFLADASGALFFILKKEVTIPARLGMRALWRADGNRRVNRLHKSVKDVVIKIARKGRSRRS